MPKPEIWVLCSQDDTEDEQTHNIESHSIPTMIYTSTCLYDRDLCSENTTPVAGVVDRVMWSTDTSCHNHHISVWAPGVSRQCIWETWWQLTVTCPHSPGTLPPLESPSNTIPNWSLNSYFGTYLVVPIFWISFLSDSDSAAIARYRYSLNFHQILLLLKLWSLPRVLTCHYISWSTLVLI